MLGRNVTLWARLAKKTLPAMKTLLGCLLIFGLVLSGCQKKPKEGKIPSSEGLEITLADVREPHLPGAPSYQDSILEAVKGFEAKNKVKVNVVFLERKEIEGLLLEGKIPEKPDLAFDVSYSGEWPFCPDGAQDVSVGIQKENYIEQSIAYWSKEGRIVGVPSYVHWFSMAARDSFPDSSPTQGQSDQKQANPEQLPKNDVSMHAILIPEGCRGKTGYWPDTEAFFRVVMDKDLGNAKKLEDYLSWVKEDLGRFLEDPLDGWQNGSIRALYPVNPYLLRWLRVSSTQESREKLHFQPLTTFHTIPGYYVFSEDETRRSLALELAVLVAKHRGRWAARAIGGIPACVQDMTTFNLESGFSYEERQMIFDLEHIPSLEMPTAKEHARMDAIIMSLEESVRKFLSGSMENAELEKSILQVLKDHTKP